MKENLQSVARIDFEADGSYTHIFQTKLLISKNKGIRIDSVNQLVLLPQAPFILNM